MGRDNIQESFFFEPSGHVRAPSRENMIAHKDIIHLLDSADVGDYACVDLFFREGIRRKTGGERDKGLSGGLLVDDDDLLRYIIFLRLPRGNGEVRRQRGTAAHAGAFPFLREGELEIEVRVRVWREEARVFGGDGML